MAAAPAGMEGRWIGTWQSTSSGHEGQLRAMLRPLGDGRIDAKFRARFWGIMAYSYEVELETEESASGLWHFVGGSDLGWLAGGRFTCQGTASTEHLEAIYESKRDRGKFMLARPTDQP